MNPNYRDPVRPAQLGQRTRYEFTSFRLEDEAVHNLLTTDYILWINHIKLDPNNPGVKSTVFQNQSTITAMANSFVGGEATRFIQSFVQFGRPVFDEDGNLSGIIPVAIDFVRFYGLLGGEDTFNIIGELTERRGAGKWDVWFVGEDEENLTDDGFVWDRHTLTWENRPDIYDPDGFPFTYWHHVGYDWSGVATFAAAVGVERTDVPFLVRGLIIGSRESQFTVFPPAGFGTTWFVQEEDVD